MEEKINAAIENTVAMIRPNVKSEDSLRFSQAALNLAHAKMVMKETTPTKTKGGSA